MWVISSLLRNTILVSPTSSHDARLMPLASSDASLLILLTSV